MSDGDCTDHTSIITFANLLFMLLFEGLLFIGCVIFLSIIGKKNGKRTLIFMLDDLSTIGY